MIYDLRIYDFRPGGLNGYVSAFQDRGYPVITRNLRLAGYWIADTGRINRAFHLWGYNDAADRATRRKALYDDRDWTEGFLPATRELVGAQSSELLKPVGVYGPETLDLTGKGETGQTRLFELRTYEFSLSGAADVVESLRVHGALLDRHLQCIGYWRSISGSLGRVRSLWAYTDESDRDRRQAAFAADPAFHGWMHDIGGRAHSVVSDLLRPTTFSPIA
jgi:hypothetical protein